MQDPEPKGSVDLKGCTWTETVKGEKKKNLFAIIKDDKEQFVGSVGSQSDLEGWKKDISEAFSKDHHDAPDIGGEKRKKQTVAMKMKKGAASKTAKSAVGKRVSNFFAAQSILAIVNLPRL